MKQKIRLTIIGVILFLAIAITAGITMYSKFAPSKKVMKLEDYYQTAGDDSSVVLVLQDKIYEQRGKLIDGQIYVDYDTVVTYFNKRFYWDDNESLLLYTTPTEIIKTEVGSKDYYINKSKKSMEYAIAKVEDGVVYIALDYVKEYSNLEYTMYEDPNRVVITYIFGEDYLFADIKEATQLRYKPSIKGDILKQMKKGDRVQIIVDEEEVNKNFTKVITEDGIIGYVKNSMTKNSYYEATESKMKEPEYTSITKDHKINMTFHQVTNQTANNHVLELLGNTKGVTTISPTWFKVSSVEGNVDSLASETYVQRAHNYGVEVWALVDDFTNAIDMSELLSYTSRREKLSNELIALAIKYNLDGLNMDFEKIPEAAGKDYIQFLREMSVKCRNNGIILSVDNYVPSAYTSYYDREEQGILVDYVITMAYDEHINGSDGSGSVASISFVSDAVTNVLKEVPAEKNIIAIPFYTRLWEETADGVTAKAYSMDQAQAILDQNNVEATWDEETKQYYGEYESSGNTYKIWLEEEKSLEEKLKVISENNVAGIASWKLGLERSNVWSVILKYVN
ncbi:glycosyl hydrolase family 18 protein [Anaerosporobacter faecicola]|uniref:glycosyl hydrolase family 18 protein n=1 Tax=Anaerosporobacter faecicola TaxID=2718714 RepID=UPI001EE500DE|nr:glycosyl hydrolase family 18 protein [Anaerosporobacter faecicola]